MLRLRLSTHGSGFPCFLLFESQPLKIRDPHAAEEPIYETIEETGLELKEGKPLILGVGKSTLLLSARFRSFFISIIP
jgi:hypothetical protein